MITPVLNSLFRRLHCKSNSLHLNLFIAFILRAIISFIKSSLFVEGVGLEKDIRRIDGGDIEFIDEGLVRFYVFAVLLQQDFVILYMLSCEKTILQLKKSLYIAWASFRNVCK